MSSLPATNTSQITTTDRSAGGSQPDNSTPTGTVAAGNSSITNVQLAKMNAFTTKANVTGNSASPQDVTVGQLTTMMAGGTPVTSNTTIALAKLTQVSGNNGSLTLAFSNGLATFVSYLAPT